MQIFQQKNAKIKFFKKFSQNILVFKKLFVTLQCEIKIHA